MHCPSSCPNPNCQSNREDLNYVPNIYKGKKRKHTLKFICPDKSKKMANFKMLLSRTSPKGRYISAGIRPNYLYIIKTLKPLLTYQI